MKPIPLQDDDKALVQVFRALGHPDRLRIFRLLAERQNCICGEIVDELPLAQATISEHLKVMKDAGLITGEIKGPAVCYGLSLDALTSLLKGVTNLAEEGIQHVSG